MTTRQTELIEKLAAKEIEATFNDCFLNCRVAVKSGQKTKWQKFSFAFDSAEDCQGSRLLWKSCKGAYSEHLAREAAEVILLNDQD